MGEAEAELKIVLALMALLGFGEAVRSSLEMSMRAASGREFV
jgi:hypothetical protein